MSLLVPRGAQELTSTSRWAIHNSVATPTTTTIVAFLTCWRAQRVTATRGDALFCTRTGNALSRDAIAGIVTKHTTTAARACSTLAAKTVTPHTLRHTAAELSGSATEARPVPGSTYSR